MKKLWKEYVCYCHLNNPAILFYYKVLAGDVEPAVRTHKAFYTVWKRYGFTPEGFNLATSSVQVI